MIHEYFCMLASVWITWIRNICMYIANISNRHRWYETALFQLKPLSEDSARLHLVFTAMYFVTNPSTAQGRQPCVQLQTWWTRWQGGPVIPADTRPTFRRFSRLVKLRWRYSNPPPHGEIRVTAILWTVLKTMIEYESSRRRNNGKYRKNDCRTIYRVIAVNEMP
jgi:hypothetical protein